MRTKTLALSALVGLLGSAAAMATNVYSVNAVGFVTVTVPSHDNAILTVPLIASPDNTINTLLNNGTGSLNGSTVSSFTPGVGWTSDNALPYSSGVKVGHTKNTNGWAQNGVDVLAPGSAFWFYNGTASAQTLTFVGTVPQGSLTNTLAPGFNLVGSAVPTYGDLCSNSITALTNYNSADVLDMFDPALGWAAGIGGAYNVVPSTGVHKGTGYHNNWKPGDPTTFNVTQGFWYFNSGATINWVENFSVNP